MTFRQFAFNNVVRNKRLYAAYFLSSMFTVMVFFTFAIFAFHPVLTGEGMRDSVVQGMNISAGIIYVFSFFFVMYSMSSFLQTRKKEFGLLMLQGMSMRQIRSMVFLENNLIGLMATLGGIGLGLIFSKGILLAAENVLVIEQQLPFYLPLQAVILTFVAFIVLFFIISLFVSYVLRSRKLIDLIKGDKKTKGEPKANLFLVVIAVLFLGGGYFAALTARGTEVVVVMLPVIVAVIIGTYFLFTQLSVFIIRRLKGSESIFWRKTNMLLLSDLSFRMKDNARTFFMVAIVSTVAFCAIGALFGFQSLNTSDIKASNPNTLTYRVTLEEEVVQEGQEGQEQSPSSVQGGLDQLQEGDVSQLTELSNVYEGHDDDVNLINQTLRELQMETEQASMVLSYYETGSHSRILIVKQSDFNRFAELIGDHQIELQSGEMIVVEVGGSMVNRAGEILDGMIELTTGESLQPNEVIQSRALPGWGYYYVISDQDAELLPKPISRDLYVAWQATAGEENVMAAVEKLYETFPSYQLLSAEYMLYQINKGYGPIMFVGLFIGIVFFVSAGSFLYFRLYMDLDGDKQKFSSIAKMGLTDKELKKVLNRQTIILFFAPVGVALVHGAVALTALSHLFFYNLFRESVTVLSIFFAIQVVYFFVVRFFYTKQIRAAI